MNVSETVLIGAGANGRTPGQVKRAKRPRSAVTSGRRMFVEGDPNSAWARRYHDLVGAHISDMGGRSALSEAQLSLIRRAASIECELERLDALLSLGEPVDLPAYSTCASHLRRLFETLGLKRVPRDLGVLEVEPLPFSPLRSRHAEEAPTR